MVSIIVLVLELGLLLGGSAVTKALNKAKNESKSSKSLCCFAYYTFAGLVTLLIGIIGLENCRQKAEIIEKYKLPISSGMGSFCPLRKHRCPLWKEQKTSSQSLKKHKKLCENI